MRDGIVLLDMFSVQENHILLANKNHTIADSMTNILYAAEIVVGKDTPPDYVHEYGKEEGKTSSLLARLTRLIWHTGKLLVIPDSGFCVIQERFICRCSHKEKKILAFIHTRGLSIEMMQNTCDDEDDGVQDSNNEPRRSPRQ
ncbi:hypothetical protein FRACYDRAFT_233318 [Fragilariopsis cylindrus CCMP1102]|uniref:Uncharacterized protein n=1 Tax=Fragilariopsis cylindrus CCMP1102 TaxID=635003 RepID=A0A1E7FYC0_9STRA|nr:hypothetical protein FRACYDRAFT_233318 [Fragilariopsis cylindrus CCMP1102]|eukprot:OEU23149.1 hypothetical protein FRACYDRAFT_233318 [Fragilariopsis cylindrus CCMP1102]